jgi:hypothetical protein
VPYHYLVCFLKNKIKKKDKKKIEGNGIKFGLKNACACHIMEIGSI